jgi:hypothetical protein
MAYGRVMPDAVLLPDASVVIIGGSAKGEGGHEHRPGVRHRAPHPASLRWSTLCDIHVPRLYHSGALLLPDATVLVVGKDGHFNPDPFHYPEHRAEIFSPPYCFRGPRPRIATAPTRAAYGESFAVGAADSTAVATAVLIGPASVTHSLQMGQRFVELLITARSAVDVTVEAPPDALVAPPGHYMLFLVSAGGVPSVARFLHVG